MTKHAKEKLARKHAKENAKQRKYTVKELELIQSDMRKQAAELTAEIEAKNDALVDNWETWVATWNQYVIPRLSVGFYVAAMRIISKHLGARAIGSFMAELSESMQNVINDVGLEQFSFEDCAKELEAAGYAVPEWAEEEDFEVVKNRLRATKGARK